MAQFSPAYIEELQRKHKLKYWKVYDRSKKLLIDSQEQLEASLDESIIWLQDTLRNCTGDTVLVILYDDQPKHRTDGGKMPKSYEMYVRLENAGHASRAAVPATGAPTFSELLHLHQVIADMKLEAQRKEMEAQLEAPAESSPVDKLITHLIEGNHLTSILSMITAKPQAPAVAAPAASGTDPLAAAIKKLSGIDPDYINTLVKMADYLEKNPVVLPQIKTIIGA
jgi:hypothetical protein